MKLTKVIWKNRLDVDMKGELHSFINTSDGLKAIVIIDKKFLVIPHHELTVV